MYKNLATTLFNNGKRSESVARSLEQIEQEAIANKDAQKLDQIHAISKRKTINIFEMSLEAADLLNLPREDFYDLYFKGGETNPANLLRGMHAQGIIKIIEFNGYSVETVKSTDEICVLEYTLDDGVVCRHSYTMEEAINTPWIREEFSKDEESLWHTNPKEMLYHEAVKFIAKTSFRRLFKVQPRSLVDTHVDNAILAEKIFEEEIYDIEIVDFEYRSVIASKERNPRDLEAYIETLRKNCIERIHASLELCDAIGLPKHLFYDISKHTVFNKQDPSYNIRACAIIEMLRELGFLVRLENVSSKSCTLKFTKDGIERTEQVILENLKKTKKSVREGLETVDSAWYNHTATLLLYEALSRVLKSDFAEILGKTKQTGREKLRSLLFKKTSSRETAKALLFNKDVEKSSEPYLASDKDSQNENNSSSKFVIPEDFKKISQLLKR